MRPILRRLICLVIAAGGIDPLAHARAQTDASGMIDALVVREWEQRHVKPAPQCSDAEFVRRVYLDLVGIIPPASEARRFLADRDPGRRAKLIDQLLRSPDFADHFANVWEILLVGRRARGTMNAAPLRQWLRDDVFAKNMAFDDFARQLASGRGRGAAPFFARHNSPNSMASTLTRTFLGVRMNCSECHDDKRGEWKQQDFWALAAFFTDSGVAPYERRVKSGDREEVTQMTARARLLPGTPAVDATNLTLREQFAEWFTSANNPWFAKATVNRTWAHFFGRGLADPVDDFWTGTEPSPPGLLDELSRAFVAHKFDFKWLARSIAGSRAYQLSSRAGRETNDPLNLTFARAEYRPLTPEQLFFSMAEAVNLDARSARGNSSLQGQKDQYLQQFVAQFANDENQEEPHFEGTVAQTLMLFNGAFVNQSIRREQSAGLGAVFRLGRSDDEQVRELFLRTLARDPSAKELDLFKRYLSGAMTSQLMTQGSRLIAQTVLDRAVHDALYKSGALSGVGGGVVGSLIGGLLGRRTRTDPVGATTDALAGVSKTREQLFEDLYWALLNSTEFLYNH